MSSLIEEEEEEDEKRSESGEFYVETNIDESFLKKAHSEHAYATKMPGSKSLYSKDCNAVKHNGDWTTANCEDAQAVVKLEG